MITLEDVSLSYRQGRFSARRRPVLKDVSWHLPDGRMTGLIGPSGSGKSSLAKLLLGLIRPDRGTITVDGAPRARAPVTAVQYVPQHPDMAFNPALKIGAAFRELYRLHRLRPRAERDEHTATMLKRIGVDVSLLDRYPRAVSGGEIQRLSLARALLLNPRTLILDESTAMLDVSIQARIMHLVKGLVEEHGVGVLLITHDQPLARATCDALFTLNDGNLEPVD